jgi:hypothetical protein
MKNAELGYKKERVVTFLDREEVDFLDKMGKDALFSTGVKLSRARLIEWLVDFTKGLNINGEGIKTENDFENRIIKSIPPATEGKKEADYEK